MAGPWEKYASAEGPWSKYASAEPTNDPADYPQGKSAAEAERMRREFYRKEKGNKTFGEKIKSGIEAVQDYAESPVQGNVLTNPLGVLPRSAASVLSALNPASAYRGLSQEALASTFPGGPTPSPAAREELNLQDRETLKGLAAPFGLAGLEAMGESWGKNPIGSALTVAPYVKPTLKGIKAGTAAAAEAVKPISPKVAAKKINIDYQKAIRPSVKGTAGSAKQIAQSDANSVQGVYDVVEAKNSGKIALGEEAEARLPQTLQEHLDAVNQAKMDAFTQYDSMKNATEGNGVVIDLQPIAETLRESAQSKALAISRPSVIQYMLDMADRFEQTKTLNPSEVQDAIKAYNSILDYSKATPEVAANAMVDKSIAAQLRKAIDDAITSDQGGGYAELKQKYGRLAQMEKEAAHRARVAGRAAPSSLFDGIMGGLTSGEIVSGLLTANPAQLARGGAMAAFKAWRNRMNSPDFQIKRMYKTAEKAIPRQEQ